MRLLASFPRLAFALVLVSIGGLCLAQQNVWLLLGAGAIAVASRTVTEGPRARTLPRGAAAVLFVALAVYAAAAVLREGVPWITVLGRFALGLTLIKLYERRGVRDWGQLLTLSLLLMIIGAVQSVDLLFGAVLLVYAGLGLHVLLLFQLYAAHARAREARRSAGPAGRRLVPGVRPAARRGVALHLHALGALIAIAGLLVAGGVFVLVPRGLGHDAVPALRRAGGLGARAGFSDRVDLRTGQRITTRRRPVMSLVFAGPVPPGPLRLRGAALDTYLGEGRWRAVTRETRLVQTRPPALTRLADGPLSETMLFTVEPFQPQSVLFSPLRPVAVTTAQGEPLRYDPATALVRRPGAPSRSGYVVRALLAPDAAGRLALADPGDPSALLHPEVRELAASMLAGAGLPPGAPPGPAAAAAWREAAATALSAGLGARCTYTLDLSDVVEDRPGATDPVRRFLFDTRRGHCEYFASALVALAANVGIPARLVTGFVAYETTPGRSIVLEANAHAWCEVQVAPGRWITVDPTPPATLRALHVRAPTLLDRLSWIYERFEGSWRDRVILFDRRAQQRLSDALDLGWGETVLAAYRAVRAWAEQVNRAFRLGPAGYIWLGVVAFAAILAVLALVRFLRRLAEVRRALGVSRRRDRGARMMVRQLGFYVDMLRQLERAGLGKPPWRPPRQHAMTLEQAGHAAGPLVAALTDRFYAARYGRRPLSRDELSETAGLLEELAGALGGRR